MAGNRQGLPLQHQAAKLGGDDQLLSEAGLLRRTYRKLQPIQVMWQALQLFCPTVYEFKHSEPWLIGL